MKKIALLLLLVISQMTLMAQTDKQIDKAIKIYNNKSHQKGADKLKKFMDQVDMPTLRAWNTYINMKYQLYLDLGYDNDETITITTIDEDGNEETTDFYEFLRSIKLDSFINLCRKATILNESNRADYYLRRLVIEAEVDTTLVIDSVKVEKIDELNALGDEQYNKTKFMQAIEFYNQALDVDSTDYQTLINVAFAYMKEDNTTEAIHYFEKAVNAHPDLMRARNMLIDLLLKENLYIRAKKECLEAICVYPGFDNKLNYQIALSKEDKYMDEHRLYRYFYPNNMKFEDQDEVSGSFTAYREAKNEIGKYCNEDGIIEPNGVTDIKYLELYSWEKVLDDLIEKDEVPEYLDFAVEMKEEGYLDCYVLVSLYHYDFYAQTKDFLSEEENREKVKTYIETYTIKSYEN